MKGVYTVRRKEGTAVYVNYQSPDGRRVREKIDLVRDGLRFKSRLTEAKKRAEEVLVRERGRIRDGSFELPRTRRSMLFSRFVEEHYAPYLRESGIRSAESEIQRITTAPAGRFFGQMKLSRIDEWQVRRFIKSRRDDPERGVGEATINRDLARLSHLWKVARKLRLVTVVSGTSHRPRSGTCWPLRRAGSGR